MTTEVALQPGITGIEDVTGSAFQDNTASGASTSPDAANNQPSGAQLGLDGYQAFVGEPGLMVDPAQPFIGKPVNVNGCSR